MKTDSERLGERWKALKLELLVPAPLPGGFLEVVARMHRNPRDAKILEDLLLAMPVPLAEFKEAALASVDKDIETQVKRISAEKHGATRKIKNLWSRGLGNFTSVERKFSRDVDKMHRTLFKMSIVDVLLRKAIEYQFGRFTERRMNRLHPDGEPSFFTGSRPKSARYAARLKASEFSFIHAKRLASATPDEQRPVNCALNSAYFEESTIKELRDSGILEPFPVNKVALFIAGDRGTLHVSGDVPRTGVDSAFVRATRGFISAKL